MKSFGSNFRALVIGASGGIGKALVDRLRQDETCGTVVGLSRSADGLDLADEHSIEDHAGKLSEQPFDLIVCATGALTIEGSGPEKSIRQISPDAWPRNLRQMQSALRSF